MGWRNALLWAVAGVCAAASSASALSIDEAYTSVSLSPPSPRLVVICHGFGCAQRTPIGLGAGDIATLSSLLAPGRASAEAERRAIAAAWAWFDRRIGPAAGTTHRVARAGGLGGESDTLV
jgi:hypothetical protein